MQEKLKRYRKKNKITINMMAHMLGISRSTYILIEKTGVIKKTETNERINEVIGNNKKRTSL